MYCVAENTFKKKLALREIYIYIYIFFPYCLFILNEHWFTPVFVVRPVLLYIEFTGVGMVFNRVVES